MLADITGFINDQLPSDVPLFLMGHSMGGGQILNYAARGPEKTRAQIRGYIAEAPLIKVAPAMAPWKITEVAGRMAVKVVPHMHMVNKVNSGALTRDPAVNKAIEMDPLCHNTGTLEGLEGMLDRGKVLADRVVVPREGAKEIGEQAMLIISGTGDKIVDPTAISEFAKDLEWKDKTLKEYPGWYHVLHREPGGDGETFIQDVANWILARA